MSRSDEPWGPPAWSERLFLSLCLLAQAAVILHADYAQPVMVDEAAHVLSGLLYLRHGSADFYEVNPPLAKAICAAPILLHPRLVWPKLPEGLPHGERLEGWTMAFQEANRHQLHELTVLGRLPLAAFSLGSSVLVWCWSRAYWGVVGAVVSLLLWILDPLNLAWSSCVTTDAAATFFLMLTLWLVRRGYAKPSGWAWLAWATALGCALLCKFSLWILVPLIFCLRLRPGVRGVLGSLASSFAGILWAVILINLAYGAVGTGRPLGNDVYRSHLLTGRQDNFPGNRFRKSWLASVPVPLPRVYLAGMDLQKAHSDYGIRNYFMGEWKRGGWPHYYLVCAAIKWPLGSLVLAALALALAVASPRYRLPWREELFLLLPPLLLFVLISAQTGINGHLRYLLPATPFLCISLGRTGLLLADRRDVRGCWHRAMVGAVLTIPLAWNGISVALCHPSYLAYFNEAIGGSEQGADWVLDSNLDWGQDMFRLRSWALAHPDARPLFVICRSGALPHLLGIPSDELPTTRGPLPPGYYALSVSYLRRGEGWSRGTDGTLTIYPPAAFASFRGEKCHARIGTSIQIFKRSAARD